MIVLLAVVLPSCKPGDDGVGYWENEREIIALTQSLTVGEYRLGLSEPGIGKELDNLKSILSKNETRLRGLQSEKAALSAEVADLETLNKELGRMAFEQNRSNARGMKHEMFTSRDGRVFRNVTITAVRDAGVEFRHEHGAARLRYGELSDQQRLFFRLEESAALAAEYVERRQELAYENDIDMEMEAILKREAHAAAIDEMNSASPFSRAMSQVSFRKPVISELSKPAKPFGGTSFYRKYRGYYGYGSHRPVYRYVHWHAPSCVRTSGNRPRTCASFISIP